MGGQVTRRNSDFDSLHVIPKYLVGEPVRPNVQFTQSVGRNNWVNPTYVGYIKIDINQRLEETFRSVDLQNLPSFMDIFQRDVES